MRDRLSRLAAALLIALVLASSAAPSAAAEEMTFTLDAAASGIAFSLGATLHTVEGSFPVVEGVVSFDPATGVASGRVVVDAAGGDTGNDKRDRDMHAKVLESEEYPQAVFAPTRLEGQLPAAGNGAVTLHGELTLHGAAHEVAIPAGVEREGSRLRAVGTLTVPYVEWGMKDPSKLLLRVAKAVEVTVTAVGELAPAGPAAAPAP